MGIYLTTSKIQIIKLFRQLLNEFYQKKIKQFKISVFQRDN